jgi:hypothetical protein
VAQGVAPEFKPQYCKKQKTTKKPPKTPIPYTHTITQTEKKATEVKTNTKCLQREHHRVI